jgi:hypothetical protein
MVCALLLYWNRVSCPNHVLMRGLLSWNSGHLDDYDVTSDSYSLDLGVQD